MLTPNISPAERLLFRSDVACVGQCRFGPDSPQFSDSERPACAVVAFYRSTLWIQHEGREAVVADPSVATFHNAGESFVRRRISNRGDHCDWFALAPDVTRAIVAEYDPRAQERDVAFTIARLPVSAEVFVAQRHLVEHLRRSPSADVLGIEEKIVSLYGRVIARAFANGFQLKDNVRRLESARHRAIVEHVRAILAASFRENLSIRSVARSAGCSVFHLCRIFRSQTGTTLRRHVIQLRLRNAFDQLRAGAGDLSALAQDLGFSSHSHFTAAFKANFGVPPSKVARRIASPVLSTSPGSSVIGLSTLRRARV